MTNLSDIYENNGFFHEAPAAYLSDTGALAEPIAKPGGYGMARLLNASSTPFPVNLTLDGVPRIAGSIFSGLTAYAPVPAGRHRVSVMQGGSPNALLLEKDLAFDPFSHSTAVLVDSAEKGVDLLQFADQPSAPCPTYQPSAPCPTDQSSAPCPTDQSYTPDSPYQACPAHFPDQACLRTVNVSMEGSSFALHQADGGVLHEHIPFGSATPYRPVSAGPYSFYLVEDSGFQWLSGPVAASSLHIRPGESYTLYLLGNIWSPYGFRIVPVKDA